LGQRAGWGDVLGVVLREAEAWTLFSEGERDKGAIRIRLLSLSDRQEAAATVEAVGEEWQGDFVPGAAFRVPTPEHALPPASRVVPVSTTLSAMEAAAAMLQRTTAHYLMHSAYPIQKDNPVLVHAGAGDVGLLLTQMAEKPGAHVRTDRISDYALTENQLNLRMATPVRNPPFGTFQKPL
jgi:hypothetical protein